MSNKNTPKKPGFDSMYRQAIKGRKGKDLYLCFCKLAAEAAGRDWCRTAIGSAVWVWNQNELKQTHENKSTPKQLCQDHYFNAIDLFSQS